LIICIRINWLVINHKEYMMQ